MNVIPKKEIVIGLADAGVIGVEGYIGCFVFEGLGGFEGAGVDGFYCKVGVRFDCWLELIVSGASM